MFMHPTYNTVGSALRLAGERMTAAGDSSSVNGVVVVPWDEGRRSPAWSKMLRHFAVVGRLEAGGNHLEANVLGRWRKVQAKRGALILTFPRARAGLVKLIHRQDPDWEKEVGYAPSKLGGGALPLQKGAFVYSGSDPPGGHGELYELAEQFSPEVDEQPVCMVIGRHRGGRGTHLRLDKKGVLWRPAACELW